MHNLRSRVSEWMVRLLDRVGYRKITTFALPADIQELHRRVLEEFPDTPWVAGGLWSWYSEQPSGNVVAVAYPYLPLVLLFKEDDAICNAANRFGIVYHVQGRPIGELEDKMKALKHRAILHKGMRTS